MSTGLRQLIAVYDFQDASTISAIAKINAIPGRPRRHSAVQFRRRRPSRSGLLPRQSEIADKHGMRGVAEIIYLRHATHAPVRHARNQVRYACVAFPPALV